MKDPADGQRVFEDKVQTLAEEFGDTRSHLDKKVMGIIFTATSTGLEPTSASYLTVHPSLGYALVEKGGPNDHLFTKFHEMLGTVVPF